LSVILSPGKIQLLAHPFALNEFVELLLCILECTLVDGERPAIARRLRDIMRLIKNEDTILDDGLVLLVESIV
jgi:hypothetical protein